MIHPVRVTVSTTGDRLATHRARLVVLSCLRAFEIAWVIALHLIGYAWHRAARIFPIRRSSADPIGQHLVRLLEALGPTFIKFGQVLSSRPDLVPSYVVQPLAQLQDRVTPFDAQRIPGILAHEFGRDMNDVFESFDAAPVAAGSIAQVHHATLKDGRHVAVKIRRPNIERMLECDLRILRAAGKLVDLIPFFRTIPLSEMVRDVGEPIRDQLDFVKEADNNRQFRRNFAGIEHIRFPTLIDELCTPTVLTMEYIEGLIRLDAATSLDANSRRVAALAGLRALYRMIFIHGLIHADMHPGNVFVRGWGEFVALDTGLVAVLSAIERRNFAEFFFGIVNNEGLRCAQIIVDDATYRAKYFDRRQFESDIGDLISRYSSLKSYEFEVAQFVYELINLQRQHGLRGSTRFMTTILAMVVYDGICKQLHPGCDFQKEARGFLIAARYANLNEADDAVPGNPLAPQKLISNVVIPQKRGGRANGSIRTSTPEIGGRCQVSKSGDQRP